MKSADAETWSLVQLPIETWTVLSEVRLFGRRRPVEPGGHRAARTLRAVGAKGLPLLDWQGRE
jgi:hypothetical protein